MNKNQETTAKLKDSIYKTDTGLRFLIHEELWQKTSSLIEKQIFPGDSNYKESACNAGEPGSIPG